MAVLDAKLPAFQATTKAIAPTKVEALTLEGKAPLVIDGGTVGASRVLLKNQVKLEQNGLWEVTRNECIGGTGKIGGEGKIGVGEGWTLVRPSDSDSPGDVTEGMLVPVEDGATNQQTSWIQRTPGPIEVGTTAQTFEALIAGARGVAGGELEGTYSKPSIAEAVIDNNNVSPEAAIGYSKLNLASKVAATDLATSAKELAPQLLSPAAKKLAIGEINAKWTASKESAVVEVAHGLGTIPKSVNLTVENNIAGTASGLCPVLTERTKTAFKFRVSCNEVITAEFPVTWEAIG